MDIHLPKASPPQLVSPGLKLLEHLDKVSAWKGPSMSIVDRDSHLVQSQAHTACG